MWSHRFYHMQKWTRRDFAFEKLLPVREATEGPNGKYVSVFQKFEVITSEMKKRVKD